MERSRPKLENFKKWSSLNYVRFRSKSAPPFLFGGMRIEMHWAVNYQHFQRCKRSRLSSLVHSDPLFHVLYFNYFLINIEICMSLQFLIGFVTIHLLSKYSEVTFQSWSQAANCLRHTVEALSSRDRWKPVFMVFGLNRSVIKSRNTVSLADALLSLDHWSVDHTQTIGGDISPPGFGTPAYGTTRPGYCITFLKRFDESPK